MPFDDVEENSMGFWKMTAIVESEALEKVEKALYASTVLEISVAELKEY